MSQGIFEAKPSLLRKWARTGAVVAASSMDSRVRGNDVGAGHGTGTQSLAVGE
jgi:hypothetical protein